MVADEEPITRKILRSARSGFIGVGVFSFLINLLMLTGPIYMLQIYDRVLASGSIPTLLTLSLIVVVLYSFMAALDMIRQRILIRIGHKFDDDMGTAAFSSYVDAPMKLGPQAGAAQPIRDVDQLRSFFSSPGITALFDMPWMPIYLGVVFMIHPYLGLLATAGAVILLIIAVITDRLARNAVKEQSELSSRRSQFADSSRRNAEVVRGMGMLEGISDVWNTVNRRFLRASARSAEIISSSSVVTKTFRLALQSGVLGLGAYLAVIQEITPGAMIAASIIMSRALQPVEQAVSNYRQFLSSRQSYRRLEKTLQATADVERMHLPKPTRGIATQSVSMAPPGSRRPTVMDVSFEVPAGSALGIIGRSGSGKSPLARGLVGVWPVVRGSVTLDGAPIDQFPASELGRHIGYLPQDVELFQGTVADNIARFDPDFDPNDVVDAATQAGVHDLILTFPDGYNTPIGEGGAALSGGQRQRVALARALYSNPFLVVLDEPNSSLDSDGERALMQAIQSIRKRGGVAVVIAHRPSAVRTVDLIAMMDGGRLRDFGPKDQVLDRVTKGQKEKAPAGQAAPANPQQPVRVVSSQAAE